MEIVLIRHGLAPSNEARRYLGRADEPLSPAGRAQAQALGERGLPEPDAVFSSPLRRCTETARLVFPRCEPVIVPEFVELDFGRFEGRTHAQLMAEEPDYAAWLNSGGTLPVPGGESQEELRKRARAGFLRAVAASPCRRAAVVTHSGVIMALLAEFARPPRAFYDCFVKNCGVVLCAWDGTALTVKGGDLA